MATKIREDESREIRELDIEVRNDNKMITRCFIAVG